MYANVNCAQTGATLHTDAECVHQYAQCVLCQCIKEPRMSEGVECGVPHGSVSLCVGVHLAGIKACEG